MRACGTGRKFAEYGRRDMHGGLIQGGRGAYIRRCLRFNINWNLTYYRNKNIKNIIFHLIYSNWVNKQIKPGMRF